jgi:hypothetical protein
MRSRRGDGRTGESVGSRLSLSRKVSSGANLPRPRQAISPGLVVDRHSGGVGSLQGWSYRGILLS